MTFTLYWSVMLSSRKSHFMTWTRILSFLNPVKLPLTWIFTQCISSNSAIYGLFNISWIQDIFWDLYVLINWILRELSFLLETGSSLWLAKNRLQHPVKGEIKEDQIPNQWIYIISIISLNEETLTYLICFKNSSRKYPK